MSAGPAAIFMAGMQILGAGIGRLFDKTEELVNKPIFDQKKPMPVSIEGFDQERTILHDISVVVEANFLDPSQLEPIAMRRLAEYIRGETEDLLKRENIWG